MNIFVENVGCRVLWESTIYMNILVASSPCTSSIRGTPPSLYASGLEHTLFLVRLVEEQADVPRMSLRDESWTMVVEILMTVPTTSWSQRHTRTTEGRHWRTGWSTWPRLREIRWDTAATEGSHASNILLSWPHHHQATMFSLNTVSLSLTQSVPNYKTFDFFISSLTTHLIQNWFKYHLFSRGLIY